MTNKNNSDLGYRIIKYSATLLFIFTFITCSSRRRIGANCRD